MSQEEIRNEELAQEYLKEELKIKTLGLELLKARAAKMSEELAGLKKP